jgi:hypothetical protein
LGTNPGVVLVVFGDLNPEMNHAILEILEVPEQGFVNAGVAVPALVLTAGERVHVDDGVQPLCGTGLDDAVDELEPLRSDDGGVAVIHEVAVVDGDADAVQAEGREELGIRGREEVLEKLRDRL